MDPDPDKPTNPEFILPSVQSPPPPEETFIPTLIPSASSLDLAISQQNQIFHDDSTLSDNFGQYSTENSIEDIIPKKSSLKRSASDSIDANNTCNTSSSVGTIDKSKTCPNFSEAMEIIKKFKPSEPKIVEECSEVVQLEQENPNEANNASADSKNQQQALTENVEYELKEIPMIKNVIPKNLEPLPPGWVQLRHKSSLYLYLHKQSKVVTWSRPYFLGRVNVKTHQVPLSSIPCLFQDRINEQKKKLQEVERNENENKNKNPDDNNVVNPVVHIDTATGNELITSEELKKYCQKSKFEIENVKVRMYRNWLPRNKHQERLLNLRKVIREEKKKQDKQIRAFNRIINQRKIEEQDENYGEDSKSVSDEVLEKVKEKLELAVKRLQNFREGPSEIEVDVAKKEIEADKQFLLTISGNVPVVPNNPSKTPSPTTLNPTTSLLGTPSENICPHFISNEDQDNRNDNFVQEIQNIKQEIDNCDDYEESNEALFEEHLNKKRKSSESGELTDSDDMASEEGEIVSSEDEELVRQREAERQKLEMEKRAIEQKLKKKLEKKRSEALTTAADGTKIKQEIGGSIDSSISSSLPSLNSNTIKVQFKDSQSGQIRTWSTQTNRPPQTILHDYCTRIYRQQAIYEEFATNNDKTPWKVTVKLPDGNYYGSGLGIKKKFAKDAAIIQTLEMLIPEFKEKRTNPLSDHFFDHLDLEDVNSAQYLAQAGHHSPLAFLEKVLVKQNSLSSGKCAVKPNFKTLTPKEIQNTMNKEQGNNRPNKAMFRKIHYEMTIGKHTVTGRADNKKSAQQLGAAQILKLLHRNCLTPVKYWGDLIRLYHYKQHAALIEESAAHEKDILSMKGVPKEKTVNGNRKEPNWDLLSKLRSMMDEIHEKRKEGNKEEGAEGSGRAVYNHRPSPFPGQDVMTSLPILDL